MTVSPERDVQTMSNYREARIVLRADMHTSKKCNIVYLKKIEHMVDGGSTSPCIRDNCGYKRSDVSLCALRILKVLTNKKLFSISNIKIEVH